MTLFTPRAATLLTALAAILAGCSSGEAPPPAPRSVLVQAAASAPQAAGVYTGEVRARHEVDLSFRVGGKIAARLVDAGAEIRAGQALARLDPADLELAASAARAQLAAAESDHATARAERERYAGLLTKKFVSQAAFDAKENAFNSAQARLEQARSQSRISGNQASYGTLSSEFPAIVTAVVADAGQVVGAGQAVLRIARPEEKEVAIAIPESRLGELKASKTLSVSLWADPSLALRGELRELAPVADPVTRTYAARIRILNPPPDVRLGMTARVALASTQESPIVVPLSAVIDNGSGPAVRIVMEGKVASRPVKVGRYREDGVELAGGLTAGEQVIISGTGSLADGQEVLAKPATTPGQQR
ncbi:MAG: efflux transporter periplasmic adaptor subunit [Proteobacteria bacterium]|nr:efflux transporter periplasmic adaptor subunit [Pseudomonadota bacterium]